MAYPLLASINNFLMYCVGQVWVLNFVLASFKVCMKFIKKNVDLVMFYQTVITFW